MQYNPSESDGGKKNARFSRGRAAGSRRSTRRRKSSESEEEETAPSSEDDFSDEPKRKAPPKPTRAQRMFIFVVCFHFNSVFATHSHSIYSWPRSSCARTKTSWIRIGGGIGSGKWPECCEYMPNLTLNQLKQNKINAKSYNDGANRNPQRERHRRRKITQITKQHRHRVPNERRRHHQSRSKTQVAATKMTRKTKSLKTMNRYRKRPNHRHHRCVRYCIPCYSFRPEIVI